MKNSRDRKAIIAELERNRARVAGDLAELGGALNVNRRFQESVRRHPGWWIGGGIVAGMVFSRLPVPRLRGRRGEKGKVSRGLPFLGLLGFTVREILRLSTPALTRAATDRLEQWMTERDPRPAADESTQQVPNEESR